MIINLHKSLYKKDPCKKCLVRPCCRNECEQRIDFKLCFYPYNSRIAAITMLLIFYAGATLCVGSIVDSISKF